MIDKVISHYRIIEEIGRGGMGVVYKAEDIKLKRVVALKFLPPELTLDADAKARFIHEAQAASALDHSNICTVHDIQEGPDGQLFMVMPYYEGRTLKEIMARGGITESIPSVGEGRAQCRGEVTSPLRIDTILSIASQIAKGLAAAHAKGIIHRDIKPANIFITNEGAVKILDFGIAKLAGAQTKLTKTGSTMGTAAYMSPEQTSGKDVDQRTDIWSLGVILYEMLSGRTPFQGEYMQAMAYAILNEEPKPLGALRPEIPAGLANIVARALAKNPADRHQGMNDLAANLKAAAEGTQPIEARAKRFGASLFSRKTLCLSAAAAALAVLLALDVGGIRGRLFGPGGGAHGVVRLAVLPFANLSGDPQQEYFSDGLTQEMISQLGRLHPQGLSVIARTSVMRYKKNNIPIDQIGRELKVDYVLEGSAQHEGGRVRVTAELIQVKNQAQLWADTYEREASGILALQTDVAGKVAGALALKLLPSEKEQLANARSINPEAYEAYLRGFYHWIKATPGEVDLAEKYFDLALEKDTSYAPAYVGRAWVWLVRNQIGLLSPEEAGPKAKAAALRAIELDENCAGAHEALAEIRTVIDWDWGGARESWRRTLELNPNIASAQGMYAHFQMIMGHGEEALVHSERAVVLDPFNPLIHCLHAFVLYSQRRYDEAIAAAREALRFQQDHPIAMNALWWIMHEKKGMEKEAFEAAKVFARVVYDDPRIDAALVDGHAQGGYAGAMKRAAAALIARIPGTYSMPSDIAIFNVMAGEKDKALDWLEKGLEVHDPVMPYLGYPCFDNLRPDQRFQSLLKRMNLPMDDKK